MTEEEDLEFEKDLERLKNNGTQQVTGCAGCVVYYIVLGLVFGLILWAFLGLCWACVQVVR